MSLLHALILGIVQGLTEFIPISSSGHLIIARHLLDLPETGLAFDMALNIGTIAALLVYFARDISNIVIGFFRGDSVKRRLVALLALATIPGVVLGVLIKDQVETTFRSYRLVALNLIIVAIVMLAVEWWYKRQEHKTSLDNVSVKQSAAVGIGQALALVPGVSRSGITISTGMFAGLDRVTATRFSFLLALPITIGATLQSLLDGGAGALSHEMGVVVVGIVASLLSGLLAIGFLIKYLSKHDLRYFAYYRIVAGLVLLFLVR